MYNDTVRPRRSFVRLLHAAVNAPAVDVYVNNRPVARGLKYKAYTDYLQLPPGNYNVEVYPANEKQTPVIKQTLKVEPQKIYTVAAVNDLEQLGLYPVVDFDGLDLSEFYTFPYGMGQSPQKPAQGMGPVGPYGPVGPGFNQGMYRKNENRPMKDDKDYILPFDKSDMKKDYEQKTPMKKQSKKMPQKKDKYKPYMMPEYSGMCPTCGMDNGYDQQYKPYPDMLQDDYMMDYMKPSYNEPMPYENMHNPYLMEKQCPTCSMEKGYDMYNSYPGMNPYNQYEDQNMMPPYHNGDMYGDNEMSEHGMMYGPESDYDMNMQHMAQNPHMMPKQNMNMHHMPQNPHMMPEQHMNMHHMAQNPHMMPEFHGENEYDHEENPHMMPNGMMGYNEPMMPHPGMQQTCNGPSCGMNNPNPKPWPTKKAPLCPQPQQQMQVPGYGPMPNMNPGPMDDNRARRGGRR